MVDKREDVKCEVNGEFPNVLHGKAFLIAQNLIAHSVAGNVRLVESPHQQLVQTRFNGEQARLLGEDCVNDQRVVEGDEVSPGTVERVGKPPGLPGKGPSLSADGLLAVIGKIAIHSLVNDL